MAAGDVEPGERGFGVLREVELFGGECAAEEDSGSGGGDIKAASGVYCWPPSRETWGGLSSCEERRWARFLLVGGASDKSGYCEFGGG